MVVLSLTMSYCVTDGDEPAKAPEAKKYGGNLQPTPPRSPPQNPKPHGTAAKPTLEPTLHCMGEREEPTRSPPGTHRERSRNLHGRARGTHAEPTRAHREPTGNPPQTVSKTAQEPTSHPLVFIILLFGGKGMRWETSRPLLVLYKGCSSKRTSNSQKTFQTNTSRRSSRVTCWLAGAIKSRRVHTHMRPPKSKSVYQTDTTRKTVCWTDIYEVA